MKYTVSLDLDLPRDQLVALYDDPANRPKWQRGLESATLVSGKEGQPGAVSNLLFRMGKREMPMVETIVAKDLPDSVEVAYDAKGVHNVVRTEFVATGPETTRMDIHNVFEFSGFMKVVGFLAKGAFPRQTRKIMGDFVQFAVHGKDVREA